MDLRGIGFSAGDLDEILGFIVGRKLSYQPFRFTDRHEVGEGLAFVTRTSAGRTKAVVDWPNAPAEIAHLLVPAEQRRAFRDANDELGSVYDHFVRHIVENVGADPGTLDFAEFGCNTGYFLYRLAQRGAGRTIGMDFTYNRGVFDFFNRKLGVAAEFRFSEWDSLRHRPRYADVPKVDVCLSVAVLCHLSDPLHHLSYLCAKADRAIFVWTPTRPSQELFMAFGRPGLFNESLAWPASFDNDVALSRGLLELCLRECGFEDLRPVEPIPLQIFGADYWTHQTGILALRTRRAATVYTGGKRRRQLPSDYILSWLPRPIGSLISRKMINWIKRFVRRGSNQG